MKAQAHHENTGIAIVLARSPRGEVRVVRYAAKPTGIVTAVYNPFKGANTCGCYTDVMVFLYRQNSGLAKYL